MNDSATKCSAYVNRKIKEITEGNNESMARAALAKLRRGIGKAPGSMPELWGVTLEGLPDALLGRDDVPSRGEWAVHTALTLYALHQQGKDLKKQSVSKEGASLGSAVSGLIKSEKDMQRIKRRFDAAATANSMEEASNHLRGLVQLLKAEDLQMDYPALAKDLYKFQVQEERDSVRLRWGRDFYMCVMRDENKNFEGKVGSDHE